MAISVSPGSSKSYDSTDLYMERIKKRKKEELDNAVSNITSDNTSADKPKGRSLLDKLKSGAKTVGNVAKSIGEGVTSSYKRVGRGVAETVAFDTQAQKEARKAQDSLAEQNAKLIIEAENKLKDKNLDPAKRERLQKLSSSLQEQGKESFRQRDERNKQIMERTDPIKAAAAIGSIGFDVLTAGTIGSATKLAAKQTAEFGAKQAAKKIVSGAAQGSVAGGFGAIEMGGKDTKIKDIAQGMGVGAALGGALVGAGTAGGSLFRKFKNRNLTPDIPKSGMDDVIAPEKVDELTTKPSETASKPAEVAEIAPNTRSTAYTPDTTKPRISEQEATKKLQDAGYTPKEANTILSDSLPDKGLSMPGSPKKLGFNETSVKQSAEAFDSTQAPTVKPPVAGETPVGTSAVGKNVNKGVGGKIYRGNAGELTPERQAFLEKKGYTSFVDEQGKPLGSGADKGYGMSHRPTKTGATADDITRNGTIPKDVYTNPEYYGQMDLPTYRESYSAIQSMKGKPDAEITIYRASPNNKLNEGDWVTLSKSYAKQESLTEGVKVNAHKVKAKDIQFAGDDINEFGYFPSKSTLPQVGRDVGKGKVPTRPVKTVYETDEKLQQLIKSKNDIVDAYAAEIKEVESRGDLISRVIREGGISSSAYESMPKGVKRKSGMSADKMAQVLGFEDEDKFIAALQQEVSKGKYSLKAAREEAISRLESGKSPYSTDYKKAFDLENTRRGELSAFPEDAKVIENAPETRGKSDWENLASTAPANDEVTEGVNLKPLAGDATSETGTSALGESVRKKALKEKLITRADNEFYDVPTYNKANMEQQAEYASNLVINDIDEAIAIALGKKAPPENVLSQMVFNAVEEHSKRIGGNEGANLILKLSQSKQVYNLTKMGQEIRAAAERDPHSPTNMINDLATTRAKALERRGKNVTKIAQEDAKTIKAATPRIPRETWDSFIAGLTC